MTKVWTDEDVWFALESAWKAFDNTLKAHGFTEEQVDELIRLCYKSKVYNEIVEATCKVTKVVEQMEEE